MTSRAVSKAPARTTPTVDAPPLTRGVHLLDDLLHGADPQVGRGQQIFHAGPGLLRQSSRRAASVLGGGHHLHQRLQWWQVPAGRRGAGVHRRRRWPRCEPATSPRCGSAHRRGSVPTRKGPPRRRGRRPRPAARSGSHRSAAEPGLHGTGGGEDDVAACADVGGGHVSPFQQGAHRTGHLDQVLRAPGGIGRVRPVIFPLRGGGPAPRPTSARPPRDDVEGGGVGGDEESVANPSVQDVGAQAQGRVAVLLRPGR